MRAYVHAPARAHAEHTLYITCAWDGRVITSVLDVYGNNRSIYNIIYQPDTFVHAYLLFCSFGVHALLSSLECIIMNVHL